MTAGEPSAWAESLIFNELWDDIRFSDTVQEAIADAAPTLAKALAAAREEGRREMREEAARAADSAWAYAAAHHIRALPTGGEG